MIRGQLTEAQEIVSDTGLRVATSLSLGSERVACIS